MRNLFIVAIVLLFCLTEVFAANFVPAKTTITAPAVIQYDFNGKILEIPLTVTGTPALVTFFVFTKDKADQIVNIQEGFLGWHYVNKVDTCMYFSTAKSLDIGKNNISWDGKDQYGAMVPAGEYTYYIWGFDNVNQRVMATIKKIPSMTSGTTILETDDKGLPLNNPIYYGNWWKWILGTDPMDSTLIETTSIQKPGGFSTKNRYAFDPADNNFIRLCHLLSFFLDKG